MSLRILVVEQEPHAREGLRAILSFDGHAVSVAEDIRAGFTRVASQPFDLLLLDDDVRPQRNFTASVLDLLRVARQNHPATRGIVISTREEDAACYLPEQGVLAVLRKPLEVPRLRSELETLSTRQEPQIPPRP